jgi:hypothetical protein
LAAAAFASGFDDAAGLGFKANGLGGALVAVDIGGYAALVADFTAGLAAAAFASGFDDAAGLGFKANGLGGALVAVDIGG